MASSSYDVFLNHRGPDVKKTFASYLYRRLLFHGLRVFLDLPELQQGDDLTSQIQGAIKTASVHVAIFSPNYAQSSWCLNELLLMLETLENGATIIPVYYNVKPSELRWTRGGKGSYAEALHVLENKKTDEGKLRYNFTTIENWRNALSRLAEKSGFELARYNGDEGQLLDEVVERVLKKVKKTGLEVAKYPTGLDEKLKDFENTVLLQHQQEQSRKPQLLGIVGLGGVGKTTLAKEFFNRKNSDYPRSCFLSDVRDNAAKGSLHMLQRKLLKSLTGIDNQIDSIDEGTGMLRNHLSCSKALVIVDDVDHVSQVDALLPVHTVLHSYSLILITSRNRDVLTGSQVQKSSIYNLTGLNAEHSRELFCFHSFSQPHPLPRFEYMVDKFLNVCDGLPLSLIVLGALLYGKNDISYWEDQLDKLQRILPTEIKQKLKISYDALDVEEQHIFLDIACYFIGQNRDTAIKIWDGSAWKGWLGFHNIENRCLVKVDSENCIHMHDHVRDLGREIAEEAPGLLRRLWRGTENIEDMLRQSSSEHTMTEIRGIKLRGEYNDNDGQYTCFSWCQSWNHDLSRNFLMKFCNILQYTQYRFRCIHMTKLQLVDTENGLLERILRRGEFPNLVWLRWKKCPYSSLPSWIPMTNLRVLEVQKSLLETLWPGELQAPLQLRELEIFSPLSSIPKSIGQLKHLERIVVSYGRQVILPEEFCCLQSLKTLVLRNCSEMKSLPDCFGNLTNLQHVELSRCQNLDRLSNSFGNLINLKYLNLRGCSNLTISSETLGNISTLEYLNLSECPKVEVLPRQVVHQKCLETLELWGTFLKELPSAIGELGDLEVLKLESLFLDTLPSSMGDLKNLKELTLMQCPELKCLPASVGLLIQLTVLKIYNCPFGELPFKEAGGRETLKSLKKIYLYETDISEVSFAVSVCANLQYLNICRCSSLVEVGPLPNTLRDRYFIECSNLKKIEGLCGLAQLQRLSIIMSEEMEELPSIETLVCLEEFEAFGCVKLKSIQGLVLLTKLQELNISGCLRLEDLPGLEHLKWLRKLDASNCPKLQWGEGVIGQMLQLQELNVSGCSQLEELTGVQHLKWLIKLDASSCPKLQWGEGVIGQLLQRLTEIKY